jgi:beta-lactamase regulating signal transducer with metallopeptidase domain
MLEWLLLHTVVVTLLAGLAVALTRSGRLSPAAQHLVWLVVLVKLLTPPVLCWPWALPDPLRTSPNPVEQPGVVVTACQPAAEESVLPLVAEAAVALPADQLQADAPVAPEPLPNSGPFEPSGSTLQWHEILAWLVVTLWIGGGLILAMIQAARIVRLRRRLCGAGAPPAELQQQLVQVAAALGLRPPLLQVLPDLPSPMLCGWGRPQLLWPQGLEAKLGPDAQCAVLVHELAHLRRRDHWTMWLLLAAGCVWWWHPLYWLIRRQLGRAAELACDAWVIGTLPQGRRAYAEALLEVAVRGSWTSGTAPVLGAAGSRRDFERRLTLILREHPNCRLSLAALVAAIALAVLTLPAWTLGSCGQADPQVAPAVTPPETAPAKPLAVQSVPPPVAATKSTLQTGNDTAVREEKIRELEAQIRLLVKQLHDLRGDTKPAIPPTAVPPPGPNYYYRPVTVYKDGNAVTTYEVVRMEPPAVENELTLTRVTYKLPADKAEALSSFLKQHVKVAVLETRVDGDSMTITTTPDMQRTIGQFVVLLRGKSQTKQEPPKVTPLR